MSKAERDAVWEYIHTGASFVSVVQLQMSNVLNQTTPEFKLKGKPTRTLSQVFCDDFVPTVGLMRRIYVPFYIEAEYDTLRWSFNWVSKNRENFDKSVLEGMGFENIPVQVLLFWHTLSLLTLFEDGVGTKNESEYRVPVAFSPDNSDFERDIRSLTLPYYDNLRGQGLAMGKPANYKDINSTSRFAYLMTRFFWSGGDKNDEYAIEAADIVIRNIFVGYFLSLKSRFRSMSPFLVSPRRSDT